MGCCLSSQSHENRATSHKQSLALTHEFPCNVSKSPPRPEEESVKEVLSETPKPKPDFRPERFNMPSNNLPPKTEDEQEEREKGPTKPKILLTRPVFNPGSPDPEISDSVSLSESISNTTPRERDEDELHHQWRSSGSNKNSGGQIGYRSQGQNGNSFIHGNNNNRALSAGRSPVKRAVEPGQRRNPVGENSGRRSRSPGNRANVGRSPSGRRNGPSPGRVRMVQGPNERQSSVRKVEERESVERREKDRERERERDGLWVQSKNALNTID